MLIGCLAPSLIPDLLHLTAMRHAQAVVYLSNEPFSRKSSSHRIKIRTPDGGQWLGLPVRTEDRRKPLRDVRIDPSEDWFSHWQKALDTNYGNSVYYDFYRPEIMNDLMQAGEYELLQDIILHLHNRLYAYLELDAETTGKIEWLETEAFSRWVQSVDEPQIMIEERGRYYRKPGAIDGALIRECSGSVPEYRQQFSGFEPGCCLYDLLFQYGPQYFEVTDAITLNIQAGN